MSRTRATAAIALAIALATLVTTTAGATRIRNRTIQLNNGTSAMAPYGDVGGAASNRGNTKRPAVSDDGRYVAFDSSSPTLTGDTSAATRQVFLRDLRAGRSTLLSAAPDGTPGAGQSLAPAVSRDGLVTVFESDAANLVPGDANGRSDVFARVSGVTVLVSATPEGAAGGGDSNEADVSADGRFVVFSSTAPDLVPGDANGRRDVFVRDLVAGTTKRLSQAGDGAGGNALSSAPAISPDGGFVSFYSEASNLVAGDTQGLPDVFLAAVGAGTLRRVSVSSAEKAQDDAVEPPFVQVSDVSENGRHVVFDSDATNLVKGDERGHTDIFLRDVRRGTTQRISRGAAEEANSDSVYPRVSPDGRFVTFESFANNLFVFDAKGPDSFLYDRRAKATTLLSVKNSSRRRGREFVKQVLQRPSLSADGNVTAFSSTAALVGRDRNKRADAYVRRTDPPRARIRVRGKRYRISVDDPGARFFDCRLRTLRGLCRQRDSLAFLAPGRYALFARPFGGGLRPGPVARARFTIRG